VEIDVLSCQPCLPQRRRAPWTALTLALLAVTVTVAGGEARAGQAEAPEAHHVLVIPVNLRGHVPVIIDRAQIVQALYGADNSVASRYRAISYGKLQFSGSVRDIVEAVTLVESGDFCNTGLKQLADAAVNETRGRGIDLFAYQHFVFVLPKDIPCWWTGLADIGGNRVWVKATTAKALQHELGHNLGMDHAVNWQNAAAEGSDFMGSGAASLNAPHVVQMGWLRDFPGKVIELTQAGDVTLEALEADPRQSGLPKVAIVRPARGANTYYLSYRAASAANPLCVDVPGASNANGTKPIAWTCNGGTNQTWRYTPQTIE
jgi:Gametolysin peptidase M11/Ricin-type beta-trefoil lectin domain-like